MYFALNFVFINKKVHSGLSSIKSSIFAQEIKLTQFRENNCESYSKKEV